jgi:hypothetical protein
VYLYCHNESRSKSHSSQTGNTVLTYFHTVTYILWSSGNPGNHTKEISIHCTTTKLYTKCHDCVTYLVALEKAVRSRSISTNIGFNSMQSPSSSSLTSSDESFSLYGSLKQQCYTITTIPNSAKLSSFPIVLPICLLYHSNVCNNNSLKTFHIEAKQASCSLKSDCCNTQYFIPLSPLLYCLSMQSSISTSKLVSPATCKHCTASSSQFGFCKEQYLV